MMNIPVIANPLPRLADSKIRLIPVDSDNMLPTLREGDAVGAVPVDSFGYDGLYVIEQFGNPHVVRCSTDFRGSVIISNDNSAYPAQTLTEQEFSGVVLGLVAMTCSIVNKSLCMN